MVASDSTNLLYGEAELLIPSSAIQEMLVSGRKAANDDQEQKSTSGRQFQGWNFSQSKDVCRTPGGREVRASTSHEHVASCRTETNIELANNESCRPASARQIRHEEGSSANRRNGRNGQVTCFPSNVNDQHHTWRYVPSEPAVTQRSMPDVVGPESSPVWTCLNPASQRVLPETHKQTESSKLPSILVFHVRFRDRKLDECTCSANLPCNSHVFRTHLDSCTCNHNVCNAGPNFHSTIDNGMVQHRFTTTPVYVPTTEVIPPTSCHTTPSATCIISFPTRYVGPKHVTPKVLNYHHPIQMTKKEWIDTWSPSYFFITALMPYKCEVVSSCYMSRGFGISNQQKNGKLQYDCGLNPIPLDKNPCPSLSEKNYCLIYHNIGTCSPKLLCKRTVSIQTDCTSMDNGLPHKNICGDIEELSNKERKTISGFNNSNSQSSDGWGCLSQYCSSPVDKYYSKSECCPTFTTTCILPTCTPLQLFSPIDKITWDMELPIGNKLMVDQCNSMPKDANKCSTICDDKSANKCDFNRISEKTHNCSYGCKCSTDKFNQGTKFKRRFKRNNEQFFQPSSVQQRCYNAPLHQVPSMSHCCSRVFCPPARLVKEDVCYGTALLSSIYCSHTTSMAPQSSPRIDRHTNGAESRSYRHAMTKSSNYSASRFCPCSRRNCAGSCQPQEITIQKTCKKNGTHFTEQVHCCKGSTDSDSPINAAKFKHNSNLPHHHSGGQIQTNGPNLNQSFNELKGCVDILQQSLNSNASLVGYPVPMSLPNPMAIPRFRNKRVQVTTSSTLCFLLRLINPCLSEVGRRIDGGSLESKTISPLYTAQQPTTNDAKYRCQQKGDSSSPVAQNMHMNIDSPNANHRQVKDSQQTIRYFVTPSPEQGQGIFNKEGITEGFLFITSRHDYMQESAGVDKPVLEKRSLIALRIDSDESCQLTVSNADLLDTLLSTTSSLCINEGLSLHYLVLNSHGQLRESAGMDRESQPCQPPNFNHGSIPLGERFCPITVCSHNTTTTNLYTTSCNSRRAHGQEVFGMAEPLQVDDDKEAAPERPFKAECTAAVPGSIPECTDPVLAIPIVPSECAPLGIGVDQPQGASGNPCDSPAPAESFQAPIQFHNDPPNISVSRNQGDSGSCPPPCSSTCSPPCSPAYPPSPLFLQMSIHFPPNTSAVDNLNKPPMGSMSPPTTELSTLCSNSCSECSPCYRCYPDSPRDHIGSSLCGPGSFSSSLCDYCSPNPHDPCLSCAPPNISIPCEPNSLHVPCTPPCCPLMLPASLHESCPGVSTIPSQPCGPCQANMSSIPCDCGPSDMPASELSCNQSYDFHHVFITGDKTLGSNVRGDEGDTKQPPCCPLQPGYVQPNFPDLPNNDSVVNPPCCTLLPNYNFTPCPEPCMNNCGPPPNCGPKYCPDSGCSPPPCCPPSGCPSPYNPCCTSPYCSPFYPYCTSPYNTNCPPSYYQPGCCSPCPYPSPPPCSSPASPTLPNFSRSPSPGSSPPVVCNPCQPCYPYWPSPQTSYLPAYPPPVPSCLPPACPPCRPPPPPPPFKNDEVLCKALQYVDVTLLQKKPTVRSSISHQNDKGGTSGFSDSHEA